MAIAKVEPLLTTRSVSGPFDYRLPDVDGGRGGRIGARGARSAGARSSAWSSAWPSAATCRTVASPSRSRRSRPVCRLSWWSWAAGSARSTARRPAAGLGLVLPPGVGTGAEARRVGPWWSSRSRRPPEGIAGGRRRQATRPAPEGGPARPAGGPQLARRLAATAGSDRATLRRLEARGLVSDAGGGAPAPPFLAGRRRRPEGVELTGDQRAVLERGRRLAPSEPGRGSSLLPAPRCDRLRQDRDLPGGGAGDAGAGEGGDRPGARDRAHAADHGPLPAAVRRLGRAASFEDARRGALRRVAAAAVRRGARICVGPRSAVFAPSPTRA